MKLLMVRHAQSEGNATGQYGTAVADSLSRQGREQARALAGPLGSWAFDKVIVSPRLRTLQTIAPHLAGTDQQAEIWPEMAEACWHEEREPRSETWRARPSSVPEELRPHFVWRDGKEIEPTHPETFGEGLCRVHEVMDRLHQMADQSNTTILMVTHGHYLREILNLLFELPAFHSFPHLNCGMTLLSWQGRWTMEFCNRERSYNPLPVIVQPPRSSR